MRFEVRAGDISVGYRGLTFRGRKRMREVALLAVDIAVQFQASSDDEEAGDRKAFGFQAAADLAATDIDPVIRDDDGEVRTCGFS